MVTILGVKLSNRQSLSLKFQEILTKYGCSIRTRLGLHPSCESGCYPNGIILLEITDDNIVKNLELELCELEDIELQKMIFTL